MDCEACNNLLLDHLYGELDGACVVGVRKHLDACGTCNDAFERLSRGRQAARALKIIDAPPAEAALLAAVRAAAEAHAPPPSAPVAPVASLDAARPRFPRWLQRVGEVAMRRQVAMAAMFLLMIGFGLSYQFQTPTRRLQNVDEPTAQVIPARELPPAEGSETPTPIEPPHRVSPARPPSAADRMQDRRVAQQRSPSPPATTPASAPAETSPEPPTDAVGEQQLPASAVAQAGRADNSADSQATYRALPQPAALETGSVAANQRLTNDPALNRGMPGLPLGNTATQQTWQGPAQNATAQNNVQAQPVQDGAAGWQVARDVGRVQHTQGRNEAAIAAYRRALELDPPEAERTAIARDLYQALQESGHARDASDVYARYLMRANNATELANQMRSTPSSSQERPSIAHPAPSRPAARRMRQSAPATNDAYNSLGF